MAGLIEPARRWRRRRPCRRSPSRRRRVPDSQQVLAAPAVGRGALAREAHRSIRVAFARPEAVAHSNDQQIAHFHVGLRHWPPGNLHHYGGAIRIGHIDDEALTAGLRDRLGPARASTLAAQTDAPDAVHRRIVRPRQLGDDRVLVRIDVIAVISTHEFVARPVPTRFAEHCGRPSLRMPRRQRPLRRQDRRLPLLRRQRQIGRAMHVRILRIAEEPERIFDAPFDLDLVERNDRRSIRQRRNAGRGCRARRGSGWDGRRSSSRRRIASRGGSGCEPRRRCTGRRGHQTGRSPIVGRWWHRRSRRWRSSDRRHRHAGGPACGSRRWQLGGSRWCLLRRQGCRSGSGRRQWCGRWRARSLCRCTRRRLLPVQRRLPRARRTGWRKLVCRWRHRRRQVAAVGGRMRRT